MSIFKDMHNMHRQYGVHKWIDSADPDQLKKFLEFRISFLEEELNETREAFAAGDPEEIVDGLIDLIVIAAGTLDAFAVDGPKAWDEVLKANMSKQVGVKPERPNPLGLPDLIKPHGWVAPSHSDNHGILKDTF
jgi:predicted HAD superfamily Cof-like phosphohydrolase